MIRRLKKLYSGKADIRSYELEKIKKLKDNLVFILLNNEGKEKERMTLSCEQVEKKGFVTAKGIKSKIIPNQTFDLISYTWNPDGIEEEDDQLELF